MGGALEPQVSLLTTKGGQVDVTVAAPLPFLYTAGKCDMYSRILHDAMLRHPCSPSKPWSLICYNDEAKPGNKVKQLDKRAMQCIYLRF